MVDKVEYDAIDAPDPGREPEPLCDEPVVVWRLVQEIRRDFQNLACPVHVSAVVDTHDVDGPGGFIDPVTVRCEPIETASLTGMYNLVLMNGSLHYVRDKGSVLARVARVSAADALHAVALFSTATPVPAEHAAIPHVHSHIKLVATWQTERTGTR